MCNCVNARAAFTEMFGLRQKIEALTYTLFCRDIKICRDLRFKYKTAVPMYLQVYAETMFFVAILVICAKTTKEGIFALAESLPTSATLVWQRTWGVAIAFWAMLK